MPESRRSRSRAPAGFRRFAALSLLALATLPGCGTEGIAPVPAGPARPLLGLTPSSAGGAPSDSFGSAILTARATGADVFYYGVTWADFERGYGEYRTTEMRKLLAALASLGFEVYVNLHTIETNQRAMPADLAALSFSDPAVMARLDDAVDTLIQVAKEHPLVALALGNEVDAYFGLHPAEFPAFRGLYAREVTRIHAKLPGTPVGMATISPIGNANAVYGDSLNALGDLAIYTYYPFQAGTDFVHRPPATLTGDMQAMRARAGAKPFALQEVGYSSSLVNCSVPAAGPPTRADSARADSLQAEFTRAFRAWVKQADRSTCRFANWFLYTDLPAAIVDSLTRFYGFDTPGFRGYLGGLGLRRADGTPKPAWNAWRGQP